MTTMERHIATLLLGGLIGLGPGLGLFGCGGNGKVTRDEPAKEKKKERTPEAPMPENLAEAPCGNPKWGELPEQHRIDGDVDQDDSGDRPSPPANDSDETTDDEGSDK